MKAVNKYLSDLNIKGEMAFSPLMLHYCLIENELPTSYTFWRDYCRSFLTRCDEVHVLTLHGWETSAGVMDEIEFSIELALPVTYVAPLGL
jgi:hypothetical protein